MEAKWLFILHEHSKQLWFRASLYCLFAIATALLGATFEELVPQRLLDFVGVEAVQKILEILASSMLIVATFALSVMVQAFRAAATTATPRATQLLTEDSSAQNALAAFIGAFLFSIVGLIALSAGIYGSGGVLILFASTVLVVALVIVMLLRWIEQLARFGRVEESIDLVEAATAKALRRRASAPCFSARPLRLVPDDGFPIMTAAVGYIEYIDVERLQAVAEHHNLNIYINLLPGCFADHARPLAFTNSPVDEHTVAKINEAVLVGDGRTFPQDPRFGLVVLTEIALRALSPALNDPGTAIDVIGTSVRLFEIWAREQRQPLESLPVQYDRVWVPPLNEEDFFEDVFGPLSRAAARQQEVAIRLQKALRSITHLDYEPYQEPARHWSEESLARAGANLSQTEVARLAAIAESMKSTHQH